MSLLLSTCCIWRYSMYKPHVQDINYYNQSYVNISLPLLCFYLVLYSRHYEICILFNDCTYLLLRAHNLVYARQHIMGNNTVPKASA